MAVMDTHVLTGNHCLELRLRRGAEVRCHEGVLWLTFDPHRRGVVSTDLMLVPGQACTLPDAGRLYVSRGVTSPRAVFEVQQAQQPSWSARLRGWWTGAAAAPQAAARAP